MKPTTLLAQLESLNEAQLRLRWVRDDGSLGNDVDLDDLSELREWLRASRPQQQGELLS